MRKIILLVGAGLFLSVCSAANSKPPGFLYELSADGVGPINSATRFNKQEVEKLLVGLRVVQSTIPSGEPENIFTLDVFDGSERIMEIREENPEQQNIMGISVFSNKIKNKLGPQIGAYFFDVFKSTADTWCTYESNILQCMPSDPTKGLVTIPLAYNFTGEWNGPEHKIPPQKSLSTFKLSEIIWTPKSTSPYEEGHE